MIFKTFDSDIDNMSSRWGMFGKSFSDIGDTITTKWKQVTDYVAVTNDATISGMMSAWKGTSPVQFLSEDSVVNVLNDYNKALDKGAEATAKFFEAGTGNDFMNGWLKQLKGAPATMDDYKAAVAKAELAQNGLTASMVASKVAALALNVAVSMGVSIAISALIKLVDNLVHANEKAIEKAEELRDKYNDFKETNASNVKTLNDLKDEFEELSDGVSQYGDNISLTTEQYARYQEIIQQIVGMSPSLAEGYDTENGYIADKNGLLERAIELQEIEYRNELRKITNLDNLKTSMSGYIAEYKEALNGGYVTSEGNIIGTTIDTDFKNSLWKVFNTNNRDNYDGQSMARDIMESLGIKDIDKEIEKYINEYGYWQDSDFWNDYCDKIVSNLDVVTNSLTAEEVGLDDTVFDQNIEKLESYAEQYSDMKDSVKSANESIQTDLGYIAEYADGYSDLSKEQQKFVTDYLKGFDISDITSENSMGVLEYDEDKMASVKSQIKKFVEELSHDDYTKQALTDLYAPPSDNETIEEYKNRIDSALEVIRKYCEVNGIEIPIGISDVEDSATDLQQSYEDTINRFKSSEESSLDELTTKYDEAIAKRKELYSGENYVGNVDINNRPVVINDDGSYSTTSTSFQEKWIGDEENGHYIIAHFTPILPDGTVLDEDSLNEYIDKILNSDDPMEADKVENGGKGIVYKVDTEINGKEIKDDNLEDAFGVADAWDVDMHNLQNGIYASEAEIKAQIERFKDDVGGIDGSQKIKDFFDTEGINTEDELKQFNNITKGITDADEAIQKWNEHKEEAIKTSAPFDNPSSLLAESDDKSKTATLADLKSEAELMQSLQSEIAKTGNIGVDSMQKIIKQYPEAKQYLADYMSGLITEQELFSKLEDVYAEDTQQYINSLVKKNETDADFFTNVKNNNETLFNTLAENYGFDIKNWNNLAKAKLDVDKQLMAELASIWTGYYTAQKDSVTGLYTLVTNSEFDVQDDSDLVTPEMEEARVKQMAVYDKYNQIIQSLNDAAGSFAKANIDLDWNVLGKDDSSSSSSSKDTKEKLNWIERLINKISTAYSRLKNVVSDTTTVWLNRNNALSDSMSTLADEINAQSQAYEYYINAFNGYDLDDYYKNQIANGSISIDIIYDENLKNAISDCQDFYDKAQDAKTAVQELGIELKGLAKSRFDNLKSQYEEQISQITKTNDLLQKEADIIDTKGWFASTLLNNSFIEQEQKNLDKLKEERTALVNALNSAIDSGKIEEYSEDWYDMQSSIDDCTSSILDAEKALVEYDNAIRQINWDAFDRTRDDVEDLINETDFLVELLKDVGITDDDGNMTKEGQAAQALLAQKYQLYLNQAKAYKDEISKINEDLVNDPYGKELLDRKQDLIDKEQEAIKSAMSEKDAIKDLTNDAYTDFIDKLGDAIDKYKELMDTMKDVYDYEKSIREKTEALNALEKQYSAYQGDNSEEGKKNIQQLKDQINSAKDDLKDTEYEKLISDTEKILDDLKNDVQSWIDQRLDQLDDLIQDIIEQSNENASDISQTITSTAENYGYNLSKSMSDIWSTNTNNITKVLGDFSTSFIDSNNKIKDVCNDINAAVQGLLKNSNDEAQRMAEEIARQQQEQNSNNNNDYGNGGNNYDNNWENNWDSGSNGYDGGGSSGGVDWIYDPDDFNKDDLNIDTSIVDRLKWHDFASDFAARSQYYDQMGGDGEYYATYDQNVWMLDWMKSHGYRKGAKSATKGLHIYGEDNPGSEVLVTKYGVLRQFDSGDTVFNKDQVEKLWNLSKGIATPNMFMDNLGAKLPDVSNMSNNLSNKIDVQFGDVTLSLPNVHNYEDFMKQAQQDPKFEKMIQEMTFGQTLGRNSLSKLTFR